MKKPRIVRNMTEFAVSTRPHAPPLIWIRGGNLENWKSENCLTTVVRVVFGAMVVSSPGARVEVDSPGARVVGPGMGLTAMGALGEGGETSYLACSVPGEHDRQGEGRDHDPSCQEPGQLTAGVGAGERLEV